MGQYGKVVYCSQIRRAIMNRIGFSHNIHRMCTLGEKSPLAENTDLCIRVYCYVAAPALAFRPRTPRKATPSLALAMKPDTFVFSQGRCHSTHF